MALMAMALAGSLLLVVALVALRVHQQSNLQLMARSVAYTVEAAVVFKDVQAADQTLAHMLAREGVAHAVVRDARGAVFARWRGSDPSLRERTGYALARMTLLTPAVAPIVYEGRPVGEVELHGDGQALLNFLIAGLVALLACLAVSGAVGLLLARRMLRDMVTPLQALAQVARAVRRDHAKGQRVPPARLAELRELGDDFNALLAELEDREALLQQKNKALTHLALHDSLTGLPNRANFEQQLPLAIAHARDTDQPMALLFMDCDRFKLINDSLGHGAGDALLVEVARRLDGLVRSGDVAARLGGDEFAMILAAPTGQAQAQAMADRVVAAMREPLVLADGGVIQPSVSAGVAVFPQQGDNMESLLHGADAAMYEVKARRRRRATDR
ncbi:diguanylate cyclase [Oryzisolibacter sp. LB2S]|uniref:diguanylate cyclase domain-containing protein n=1 Tax=Alicycliphilus soli TaxID=3228789 RepID=UPI00345A2940